MAAPWLNSSAIFFGCKSYNNPDVKVGPQQALDQAQKIPPLNPENIRESILDFSIPFGRK